MGNQAKARWEPGCEGRYLCSGAIVGLVSRGVRRRTPEGEALFDILKGKRVLPRSNRAVRSIEVKPSISRREFQSSELSVMAADVTGAIKGSSRLVDTCLTRGNANISLGTRTAGLNGAAAFAAAFRFTVVDDYGFAGLEGSQIGGRP